MYAESWSPRLRQGDVFGQIYYPLSKQAGFQRVSGETSLSVDLADGTPTHLMVSGTPRYAVIVSHDCEFNEGKREWFLVARLQGLPKNMPAKELEELQSGNDYAAMAREGRPIAIDTFVFATLPVSIDQPQRLNFNSIVPLPMTSKKAMLKLKQGELQHTHRVLLREKLAAFVGRSAPDVPDDYPEPRPEDPSTLEWKEVEVPEGEAASETSAAE